MFGKTLLTIGIILLVIVWARNARQARQREDCPPDDSTQRDRNPGASASNSSSRLNDYRFAAWLFLALIIGSGGYLYYQRWQEDNSVVTVMLYRDGASEPVTYQVLRSELGSRAFTTIDGIRVTVADSERMEVLGL